MFRAQFDKFTALILLAAIALAPCAVSRAGTVIRQDMEGGHAWSPGGDGGSNIFEELNQRLRNIPKNSRNVDPKTGMPIDPDTGLPMNMTNARLMYLCPICREPLYKHGDEKFECIPKDEEGNPVKVARIVFRPAHCPVCNAKFTGSLRGNVNDKSGTDRDFCMHSLGKATIHSNVWACPSCGYSALIEKFDRMWNDKPLSAEVSDLVRKNLSADMRTRLMKQVGVKDSELKFPAFKDVDKFAEYITQEQIKDWVKYDNAITVYKAEHAPHVLMARLYLEGAHACRRELNSEILVPFLHTVVQEGISASIRRVQNDLIAAGLQVRRDKQIGVMLDPNHPETDPNILAEAAAMIIEYGEKTGQRIRQQAQNSPAAASQFYTKGDMFVLFVRYAGFLDRLGKMDEAEKALNEARKSVPVDSFANGVEPLTEDATKFIENQLLRLRSFTEDRKLCLTKEREYLTRAMWENLAAINQNEIKFADPKGWLKPAVSEGMDPAMSAYILGELARRCHEPAAAPIWFQAAKKLIEKQSQTIDEEEKSLGAALALPANKSLRDHADVLRKRWDDVRDWTTEQLGVSKSDGELDPKIKLVLDLVLESGGLNPKEFKALDAAALTDAHVMSALKTAPVKPVSSAPANATQTGETVKAPATFAAPPAQGKIKTRDALFKMYYDAISQYVKKTQSNPPNLATLVQEKYISPDDSCLDGKGRLVCPENQEALNYSRSFTFGSDNEFILYSLKNPATSKTLYANGAIKIPAQSK